MTHTIVDSLRTWAEQDPDRAAYIALENGETELPPLTRAQLDRDARAIARMIREVAKPGDRALMLYPSGIDFVTAFYGCLYAGVLAVPVYPPDPRRLERSINRLRAVTVDAKPAVILTTQLGHMLASEVFEQMPELAALPWRTTDDLDKTAAVEWRDPNLKPSDLAFLQYTSGSTGMAKGVCVTHANLVANTEAIKAVMMKASVPGGVAVTWLPLYHDMGLIGNVLMVQPMDGTLVLIDPLAFLSKPDRWLRAIHKYRARGSGGPNFAYDLCVRRIAPKDREGLDLSCWDMAILGAEPIRPDTLARFSEAFAPHGFRPSTFWPFYGLAECTLAAASRRGETRELITLSVDGDALSEGRAQLTPASNPHARTLIGHGAPSVGLEAVIVDRETRTRRPDGNVGEIWMRGTSVAAGYFGKAEESEAAFGARLADGEGPFFKTGDLGFILDGELYITGRIKDLIVFSGANIYPQDVERAVEAGHNAVRKGCVAAFAIDTGGEEHLGVVAEVPPGSDGKQIAVAIRKAVDAQVGVPIHTLALVGPGDVPKTSSGKLQRSATRDALASGELELLYAEKGYENASAPIAARPASRKASEEAPAPEARVRAEFLAEPDDARRRAMIERYLIGELAVVLKTTPDTLDASTHFGSLAFDSLLGIQLRNRLQEDLGLELAATVAFTHPTIGRLSSHLVERLLIEAREQGREVARIVALPPAPVLPRRDGTSRERATARAAIPAEVWTHVKQLAKLRDLTPEVALVTSCAAAVATFSASKRFTLRLAGAGSAKVVPIDLAHDEDVASRADRVGSALREAPSVVRDESEYPVLFAIGETHPQAPLAISAAPQGDGLALALDHVPALFPPGLPEALLQVLAAFLGGLARDAAWQSRELPAPPASQLAAREAAGATPLPEQPLDRLFLQRAASSPDAPAIVGGRGPVTYAALAARSALVAAELLKRGVVRDEPVLVALDQGAEQIAAALGVLRAGAACLALDPETPPERLAEVARRASVRFAFSRPALPAGVTALSIGGAAAPAAESVSLASGLAFVLEGSVAVEHRAAANAMLAVASRLGLSGADRLLAVSSPAAPLALFEVFTALISGAAVVLPDAGSRRDAQHWLQLMRRERVTTWSSEPALLRMLLEANPVHLELPDLRRVVLSGERVAPVLAREVRHLWPHAALACLSGATEASVWSSLAVVGEVGDDWKSVPSGEPLPNQRAHVLDERLAPRPDWVPGELHLAGAGLARGYLGDAERTSARFVTHPKTGERLFKTGDLARVRPDGEIELLGRVDRQVTLRGQRVDLGELEAVLARDARVAEALVILHGAAGEARHLVAYVVPRGPADGLVPHLAKVAEEGLQAGLRPRGFTVLPSLPRTSEGRVDLAALPAPELTGGRAIVKPRSDTEADLLDLWRAKLGLPELSVDDDFFASGGDSVLATELISGINRHFRVELPVALIFSSPTIAQLADQVDLLRELASPDMSELAIEMSASRLEKEIALDPAIAPPKEGKPVPAAEWRGLFLTGASGFFGTHLLGALLEKTKATIYCLVRAPSEEAARERLVKSTAKYRPGAKLDLSRIVVVTGDQSQRELGLSHEKFVELSAKVDAVFHAGANVNFAHSLETLRPTNIGGAQEVFRFAAATHVTPVHLISTINVFSSTHLTADQRILETHPIRSLPTVAGGYSQSKWVIEGMAQIARERGIPVTIYRPSIILGHSVTGVSNESDSICRLLKSSAQLGAVPDVTDHTNLVTADYATEATIALALDDRNLGGTFHVVNRKETKVSDLYAAMRAHGYQLRTVSPREFDEMIGQHGVENALYPLRALIEHLRVSEALGIHTPEYADDHTAAALRGSDLVCPPFDERLVRRYLDAMIASGYMPPPR